MARYVFYCLAAVLAGIAGCRAPETITVENGPAAKPGDLITARCFVRNIASDGSVYLTEQRQQMSLQKELLWIAGVEPDGRFIWRVDARGRLGVVEGRAEPMRWLNESLSPAEYSSLVLALLRASQQEVSPAVADERVRLLGLWYVPTSAKAAAATYYFNIRAERVDAAVLNADGYTLVARGYNFRPAAGADVILPEKILIYRVSPGKPDRQVMEIEYVEYR